MGNERKALPNSKSTFVKFGRCQVEAAALVVLFCFGPLFCRAVGERSSIGVASPLLCYATGVGDAGEGGVVDSSLVDEVSAVFSFSSTPWPLQSGQELRPVVSHCFVSVFLARVIMRPSKGDIPGQYTPDETNAHTSPAFSPPLPAQTHTSRPSSAAQPSTGWFRLPPPPLQPSP